MKENAMNRIREHRIREQMERLSQFIGQTVEIESVNYGSIRRETGELREVDAYGSVVVGGIGIPFVGYGSAVRRIAVGDDVIYLNPFVGVDYDIRNDEAARYEIVARSFGTEIADQQKREREAAEAEQSARFAELDRQAKAKAPELIEGGVPFVKPELAEEWREYARRNTEDGYSAAVIEGTVQALRALAEGQSPADAEKECSAAETGFQMGCVAKSLSHFAPRGYEWRAFWNRKYVSEERAAEADASEGVVNPAILTIG